MYKIHETYEDFDGNMRTEDFYFNFTQAEITDMQYGVEGGLAAKIQKIIDAKSTPELIKIFRDLLQKAYGKKSDDGRRFIKTKELTDDFVSTNAYSQIYMRLATDSKAAEEFVTHVVPKIGNDRQNGNIPAPAVNGPTVVK